MADIIQRSFGGGEISPSLYARSDQVKYMSGCRKALNMYVKKSGGLANRPGLRFITEIDYKAGGMTPITNVRLMRFIFSESQTYVLAHVEGVCRIIKNGALVRATGIVPWAATAYDQGDVVEHLGVNYVAITIVDGLNIPIAPASNPSVWSPLVADILHIPTPWLGPALPWMRYQQSGDTVIAVLAAKQYAYYPINIQRLADDRWISKTANLLPTINPPTTVTWSGNVGTNDFTYVITSVKEETFEESLESAPIVVNNNINPTPTLPITFTITAVPGAAEYNVYKALNGKYGYIGTAVGATFKDEGQTPNISSPPPDVKIFPNGDNAAGVVAFVQQRLAFAASRQEPEKVWMSRIGQYFNFTAGWPLQDDDSIVFSLAGRTISRVQAILEIGAPILFTEGAEYIIQGDVDGAITPFAINPKAVSYNGCSDLVDPVPIDDTAIYVQNRGSIVRDLRYNINDAGYEGRDLTVYASHLFKGKKVVAMDFAQNPDSIVWVVLDDGTFLSLSYLREHQIWGWTRHQTAGTTDGFVLDVVVVPEGERDAPYFIVRRYINGEFRFYVERLEAREENNINECFYVDSGLSYNGLNTGATTMTMIGQPSMTTNDWFTLQASASYFTVNDVGNAIVMYGTYPALGPNKVTLMIMEYVSATQVLVEPSIDLTGPDADPIFASEVNVASTNWGKAVDKFSGLDHLENETVAILADGAVVSNGYDLPVFLVASGDIILPKPAVRVHIGLPYRSDFESLDVDTKDQPLRHRSKNATHVGVMVENTCSGVKAGTTFDDMVEYKIRVDADEMGPADPKTGYFDVSVSSGWDEETRVCVRQDQPLPMTLSGIIPRYLIGG